MSRLRYTPLDARERTDSDPFTDLCGFLDVNAPVRTRAALSAVELGYLAPRTGFGMWDGSGLDVTRASGIGCSGAASNRTDRSAGQREIRPDTAGEPAPPSPARTRAGAYTGDA